MGESYGHNKINNNISYNNASLEDEEALIYGNWISHTGDYANV